MGQLIDRETLNFRHQARSAIRAYFDRDHFIEIDTPYLLATNTPDLFVDPLFVRSGEQVFQLHTSPEIWLKKVLALGLPKVYGLARVFRDDPEGSHHSKEFTMLEWYRTHANLDDLILDCEKIFHITHEIALDLGLIRPGDLEPFLTTDLETLFREILDLNLAHILHEIGKGKIDFLQQIVTDKLRDHLPKQASFCDAFFHLMLKYIEPNLSHDRPVVISRWPVQLAALAASCRDNPLFCDRFEIYFRGAEIANAYQECIDPNELRDRFIRENEERKELAKPCFPIDEDFLKSVGQMPITAGIALGMDRLFMTVLNRPEIQQILFGQMPALRNI